MVSTVPTRLIVCLLSAALLSTATTCFAEEPASRPAVDCPNKPNSGDRAAKLVDLNTATVRQIGQIPWVGNKTARAIVDRRKATGAFKSMEQLTRISGLGDKAHACLWLYAMVEAKASSTKAP